MVRSNVMEILINWGDTDKAGIVYYPNFFKWSDIAGHEFFRSCDLAPQKLEDERSIILPLMDTRCTFKRPLYYDDLVTITTTVEELNTKTIKLRHEFTRDGEEIASGYELRGWVLQTGNHIKAVEIPDDIRAILRADIIGTSTKTMFNA